MVSHVYFIISRAVVIIDYTCISLILRIIGHSCQIIPTKYISQLEDGLRSLWRLLSIKNKLGSFAFCFALQNAIHIGIYFDCPPASFANDLAYSTKVKKLSKCPSMGKESICRSIFSINRPASLINGILTGKDNFVLMESLSDWFSNELSKRAHRA